MRSRRATKWTGTIACGLIVVAAFAGLRWAFIQYRFDAWRLETGGGSVGVGLRNSECPLGFHVERWSSFNWQHQLLNEWSSYVLWPTYVESIWGDMINVPLWMPFVLIGFPTALLWRADRRCRRTGHCKECGYNLTGNKSGVCPECGTAAGDVSILRRRDQL
jgi:hypothetical protein